MARSALACLDDDMDGVAGAVAERVGGAVRAGDGQISGPDQARDNALQQSVHGNTSIPSGTANNSAQSVAV